jgi:hypothetical protein
MIKIEGENGGRVAQLGEHLLCKHVFISPKSLNRRLLIVQTPLLVGLPIGLQIFKDTLSKFGQTLTKGLDSSRTVIHLKTRRPGRSKEYPGRSPLHAARGCFEMILQNKHAPVAAENVIRREHL